MGVDAMKNAVYILKGLLFSIKTCYILVRNHPSILGIMLILFLLYRFLPSVFILLLSSSPVFICTAALLIILVRLGHHSPPKVEPKRKYLRRYSRRTIVRRNDSTLEEKEVTSVRTHARRMIDIRQKEGEAVGVADGSKKVKSKGKRVTFSPIHDVGFISRTLRIDDRPRELGDENEEEICKPVSESFDTHLRDVPKENDDNAVSSISGNIVSSSIHPSTPDINQVIDELHPVLDSQTPQPVLMSVNGVDGAPEESGRSNDVSEEDSERDGATKDAVSWKEDEEKKLMDLGCSEPERNKRLESLIARRRARKTMRREAEKNLTRSNCNDLLFQIAPISIGKNSHFDLPLNANDIEGLPPIPGSAPSILVPRKNPFDLPYDPQEEKPNLTGDSFSQEFMPIIQKDIFCRHESFCFGSNSLSGYKQDKSDRISAFFIPEDIGSSSQRQLSETSDSITSYVHETELQSPVPDQEEEKKVIGQEEVDLVSNNDASPNYSEGIAQYPEVDLVENHQQLTVDVDHDNIENSLSNMNETYMNPDIVEEKYSGLSSSLSSQSSLEMDEKLFHHENTQGIGLQNFKPTTVDCAEALSLSVRDSDLQSEVLEELDRDGNHEAVYDPCSSTIEKKTIEETFFCVDKGVVLTSFPSIASDLQVEVSEMGSRTVSVTDVESLQCNESVKSDISSGSEDHWTASSGLRGVDENESKSREVTEISETDVINAGFLGSKKDSDDLSSASVIFEPVVEHVVKDSSLTTSPMKETLLKSQINEISGSSANPVDVIQHLTSSQLEEPTAEGQMTEISSSVVEPEVNIGAYQLDPENMDQVASTSSPSPFVVERLMVQHPLTGDIREDTQVKPMVQSSCNSDHEEAQVSSIIHPSSNDEVQHPMPAQMNEPINQTLRSSAEPEIDVGVHQLDSKENVESAAFSSSPVHPLGTPTVLPSPNGLQISTNSPKKVATNLDAIKHLLTSSGESEEDAEVHHLNSKDKEPSIKSLDDAEKKNINNERKSVIDAVGEPTLTIKDLGDVPAKLIQHEVVANFPQIKSTEEAAITDNNVIKSVLVYEEEVSRSKPVVEDIEDASKFMINVSNSSVHEVTQTSPIVLSSSNGDFHVASQVHPSSSGVLQHSASSQTDEPTEEPQSIHGPTSSAESRMDVGTSQSNSEKYVDQVASHSSPSQSPGQNLMAQLPSSELQNATHPNEVATVEGPSNKNEYTSAEPDMNVTVNHLDSGEKMDPVASSSLPEQMLIHKTTTELPPSEDFQNSTLYQKTKTGEDSASSIPESSAHPVANGEVCQVNLIDRMDLIASSPSSAQLLHGESMDRENTHVSSTVQPSPSGDIGDVALESSIKSTKEANIISSIKNPAVDAEDKHVGGNSDKLIQREVTSGMPQISVKNVNELVVENDDNEKPVVEEVSNKYKVNMPQIKASEEGGYVAHILNKAAEVDDEDKLNSSVEGVEDATVNSSQQLSFESGVSSADHRTDVKEISRSSSAEDGPVNQIPEFSAETDTNNEDYHLDTEEKVDLLSSSSSKQHPLGESIIQQFPNEFSEDTQVRLMVQTSPNDLHDQTQEPFIQSSEEADDIMNDMKKSVTDAEHKQISSIQDVGYEIPKSLMEDVKEVSDKSTQRGDTVNDPPAKATVEVASIMNNVNNAVIVEKEDKPKLSIKDADEVPDKSIRDEAIARSPEQLALESGEPSPESMEEVDSINNNIKKLLVDDEGKFKDKSIQEVIENASAIKATVEATSIINNGNKPVLVDDEDSPNSRLQEPTVKAAQRLALESGFTSSDHQAGTQTFEDNCKENISSSSSSFGGTSEHELEHEKLEKPMLEEEESTQVKSPHQQYTTETGGLKALLG